MQLFDFQCPSCEHHFEELVPRGETGENLACPRCAHVGVRKLLGGFALGGGAQGGTSSSGGCGGGGRFT